MMPPLPSSSIRSRWWTERVGTDLAFADGELLLGAPSMTYGLEEETLSEDDAAWVTVGWLAASLGDVRVLDDVWEDGSEPTTPEQYNRFGSTVLAPGDLNGDGVPDLAVADGSAIWTAEDPRVTAFGPELVVSDAASHAVLRLDPLTGGVLETWAAADGAATALAAGDLDDDGALDVAAAWSTGVVYVGLFDDAATALTVAAEELAVGDFDGDGDDDLAVGGAGEVSVWRGPLDPASAPVR